MKTLIQDFMHDFTCIYCHTSLLQLDVKGEGDEEGKKVYGVSAGLRDAAGGLHDF